MAALGRFVDDSRWKRVGVSPIAICESYQARAKISASGLISSSESA